MRATALIFTSLLVLAGCKGVGLSSLDTGEPSNPPGLGNLDTESQESRENQKWFDKYYGKSQGWGWETPKDKDENCSFWSTCDDDKPKDDAAAPADNCGFYGTCEKKDSGSGW